MTGIISLARALSFSPSTTIFDSISTPSLRYRRLTLNGNRKKLNQFVKIVRSFSSSYRQASDIDQKIQDVYKRIQTERKVLEASQLLRQATSNPDVLRRNEAKIREAERQLSYFEDTLRELQSKKMMLAQGSSGGSSQRDRASSPSAEYNQRSGGRPPGGPENSWAGPPQKKVYSNLDLIKADTPVTTARISRMLHQLEFKLQVETQYKKGIDKMVKLYQAEGDKKSRADAEAKRVESEKKIQLLQASLKRYKNLFIMESEAEEPEPVPGTYLLQTMYLWDSFGLLISRVLFRQERKVEKTFAQSR